MTKQYSLSTVTNALRVAGIGCVCAFVFLCSAVLVGPVHAQGLRDPAAGQESGVESNPFADFESGAGKTDSSVSSSAVAAQPTIQAAQSSPSPTPTPSTPDGSLREGAKGNGTLSDATSPLDQTFPIHPDSQVTRWLVQAALLEKEKEAESDADNINRRLKLYEQIVVRTCAPSFALNFQIPSPLPSDPACLATLGKIKTINSTNPTVACLEHGLRSEECISYTNQQRIASTTISDRNSALYRLTIGTAEPAAVKNYESLKTQAKEASVTKAESITPLQIDTLQRYLSLTCREYSLGTEYLVADKTPERDPARRELLADIDSMSKRTPNPVDSRLRLVRLLPDPCFDTISAIKANKIPIAAVPCYELGPLAPQCVQALIADRANQYRQPSRQPSASLTPVTPRAPKGKDGLQGF